MTEKIRRSLGNNPFFGFLRLARSHIHHVVVIEAGAVPGGGRRRIVRAKAKGFGVGLFLSCCRRGGRRRVVSRSAGRVHGGRGVDHLDVMDSVSVCCSVDVLLLLLCSRAAEARTKSQQVRRRCQSNRRCLSVIGPFR